MSEAIGLKARGMLAEKEQGPLNWVGPDGQHSFRGRHQAFFQGTTGLIATQWGLHGVSIGRLRTGVYGIAFPRIKDVDIIANVHSPSGTHYQTKITGISGAVQVVGMSGLAELHVSRTEVAQTVQTGLLASGLLSPHNPVSGTYISFWFDGIPNPQLTPY